MTRRMSLTRVIVGVVAGFAVAAAAPWAGAVQAQTGAAFVRAAHLSPDTPSVDVYLTSFGGGTRKLWLSDVGYGDVSSYERFPSGTYAVSMRKHGAAASSPAVLTWTIALKPGAAYTAAAVGQNSALRGVVLSDSLTAPRSGTGLIRVIQASSQAGRVTVSTNDGAVVTRNVAFGATSKYIPVKAGRWSVQARSSSNADLTGTADVSVASESITSLVVLDARSGGLVVRPLSDAAGAKSTPSGAVPAGGGGTARPVDAASATLPAVAAGLGALVALCVGLLVLRRRTS